MLSNIHTKIFIVRTQISLGGQSFIDHIVKLNEQGGFHTNTTVNREIFFLNMFLIPFQSLWFFLSKTVDMAVFI